MALSLAMMGAGAGISLLSGLGMGFGYGYGVRAGYNAYEPSKSKKVNNMVLSPNPIESGAGMGLHTAEQRTDTPLLGTTTQPTPETDPNGGYWAKQPHVEAPDGRKITKSELKKYATIHKMDMRSITRAFIKRTYPFNQQTYKKGRPSR